MTDEHRVTVKDIIDLLDYNREGRRNIRIIDSESRGRREPHSDRQRSVGVPG